jgi:peptidoglycan/xylan/chitin deacetylase (PgdA/CDA1 family)
LTWLAGTCHDRFGPRLTQAVGILMYHRVTEAIPGVAPPTWNVPPAQFAAQLEGLLARGWCAWPLEQVIECHRRREPIPRRTFVVTFDDGYANNCSQALPILKRLGVPATVFLATAYLDSRRPLPFDDWEAAGSPRVPQEAWRPLSTAECQHLVASGLVTLGAHTHTHADFRGQPERLRSDLAVCLSVLRKRFFVESPPMALPYGTPADGFASNELIEVARQAGVSCCLTTQPQLVRPHESPFGWGRRNVEASDTAATLAGWLGGWETAFREARAAAARLGGWGRAPSSQPCAWPG